MRSGIDTDAVDRQAHRQALAVAVEDVAARRVDFDFVLLLLLGEPLVVFVVEDLEDDEPEPGERRPRGNRSAPGTAAVSTVWDSARASKEGPPLDRDYWRFKAREPSSLGCR